MAKLLKTFIFLICFIGGSLFATKEEDQAATKIQARARGFLVRKKSSQKIFTVSESDPRHPYKLNPSWKSLVSSSGAGHQLKKVAIMKRAPNKYLPLLVKKVDPNILSKYGMGKEASNGSSEVIEALSGRLYQLLPHSRQPDYFLVKNFDGSKGLSVAVELLQNVRPLKEEDFTDYKKGLASLILLSLVLEEWDLKLDNMLWDNEMNAFIKIDNEWCFFSQRNPSYLFDYDSSGLDMLPLRPSGFKAFKFMGSERSDQTNFAVKKSTKAALASNLEFVQEKWKMTLVLLSLTEDLQSQIIDSVLYASGLTIKDFNDLELSSYYYIKKTLAANIEKLTLHSMSSQNFKNFCREFSQESKSIDSLLGFGLRVLTKEQKEIFAKNLKAVVAKCQS